MEDWVWIIFVVISFGVWLVVTVFRKAEEERQRTLQKQRPRPDGGRRPMTDLDRFLEEARRRRGDGEPTAPADVPWARPVQPPAPPKRRPVATPPQAPRPARQPAFQPSVRRSASEQRPRESMATPRPSKPSLAPLVPEIVAEDVEVTVVTVAEASAPAQVPLTQIAGVLGARETRVVSPFLKQLRGMVGQPQSMATAFVLVEIFGAPVSRKGMG